MQPDEQPMREAIERLGPRVAFDTLIAANEARILSASLDDGREIAAERTAIHTAQVAHWAAAQQKDFAYDRPFAVVALGGTGRREMAPCSDLDFAFLFDDGIEGNRFLLHLQRQVLPPGTFAEERGFTFEPLPFNLDDVPRLEGKQLNAFLDLRPVHDPDGLAGRFRERLRATADSFEHFLHVRSFWKGRWEKAAAESERLDAFDIKNDGLRVFLAGVWTLAGKAFLHAEEVYRNLLLDDPRDLEAYAFLMRIRAFVHLRQRGRHRPLGGGNHAEDVLHFEDFLSFGDLLGPEAGDRERFEFANEVRARLLAARRRVARFANGVIHGELRQGRPVAAGSPIVFGPGGLYHATGHRCQTPHDRSRAALSLVLASQRYGVPIDPTEVSTTFRNAGDWLVPVPELSALFYERRGSLARSFEFLSQFDGAEEKLFPGYARFEASLDNRVLSQRRQLRSALEREKLAALEQFVADGRRLLGTRLSNAPREAGIDDFIRIEAARLDGDQFAAVRLALKTKRLPVVPGDEAARDDASRRFEERFSSGMSGIPLADYYRPYAAQCEFTPETLRLVEFLQMHRNEFRDRSESGLNSDDRVDEFVALCRDENLLRALFIFTAADRAFWHSTAQDPVRWFNTRELYDKAMSRFRPGLDPRSALGAAGYSPREQEIIRDFGDALFGGAYSQYLGRFGTTLLRLADPGGDRLPKAAVLRDGAAVMIGVAAQDYPGLAATITGSLRQQGVEIRQAHLFSAMNYTLALDFFHVVPGARSLGPEVTRQLEADIVARRHIAPEDEAGLPVTSGRTTLTERQSALFRLVCETCQPAEGLLYAITYKVHRHLRGNIFGLEAHSVRDRVFVTVHHSLPPDLPLPEALAIVQTRF